MSQLFLNPGDALIGPERQDILRHKHFNEIQSFVDRATNDLLLNADWEAVLQCCDQVNNCLDDDIIREVIFLLRRKLGCIATVLNPVSTKQVHLTLTLAEALVKNCGTRLHKAINDVVFMTEMKKVAKRYYNKAGQQNIAVAELSLDIMQAWGEGFLTRRRAFPNIVDAYHELKKDGLPFKAQYDPSRVPIFTPDGPSSGTAHMDSTDAILASAMAGQSIEGRDSMGGRGSSVGVGGNDNGNNSDDGGRKSGSVSEAMTESIIILVDLMRACAPEELQHHEVAQELVTQVDTLKAEIMGQIEMLLLEDKMDVVAALIAINDDASTALEIFNDAITNKGRDRMSQDEMLERLKGVVCATAAESSTTAKDAIAAENTEDLLGFDEPSSPSPATHTQFNSAAPSSSGEASLLDLLSDPTPSHAAVPVMGTSDPFAVPPTPPAQASTQASSSVLSAPNVAPNSRSFQENDLLGFSESSAPAPASASAPKPLPKIAGPPTGAIPKLMPPPQKAAVAIQPIVQTTQEQERKSADPTNPFDMF